jgi:O-antigen ligase
MSLPSRLSIAPPALPVHVVAVGGLSVLAGLAVAVVGPSAAVLPLAALVLGYIWLRAPGILLAAYVFLPFYKASLQPYSPVDLTPLLAVANATQAVLLLRDRVSPSLSRAGLALWVGFGVVVLGGVLWAANHAVAIDRAAYWWLLIVLPSIAAVRVAASRRHIDQFIGFGLAVGIIVVTLGLPSLFGEHRLTVIGENTIQTGIISALVIVLVLLWAARSGSPWRRTTLVLIALVALLECVATGSRGPLVALAVTLAASLVARVVSGRAIGRSDLVVAGGIVTAGVLLVVALSYLPGVALTRLLTTDVVADAGDPSSSIGTRFVLFQLAVQMFSTNPILGVGTGGFQAYTATQASLVALPYPHNGLLQIAAEFGLVGTLVFLMLCGLALLRRLEVGRSWIVIRLMFVYMLTASMFSGDIYGDRLLWALLVLLICAPAPGAPAELPDQTDTRPGPVTSRPMGLRQSGRTPERAA